MSWSGVATRAAVLPIAAFAATFAINLLHIAQAEWGARLLPAFAQSDAYYYLHKAWFAAYIDPSGGELRTIIPLSPYVKVLTWGYALLGPAASTPFLINATLLSFSCAFAAVSTRRLFGTQAGWAAAALIALCGPLVFFAGLTVKTNLEVALLAGAMYSAIVYFQRPSWVRVLWPAALGAALTIDRNNMAVLLVALAVAVAIHHRRQAGQMIQAFAAAIAAVALVAVMTAWEPAKIEQRFFSPIGLNFYVGNAPGSFGSYTFVAEIRNDLVGHHTTARAVAEKHAGRPLSSGEVSRYWFARSWQFIREQPGAYAMLQVRKIGLLFAAAGHGSPEEPRLWRWSRPALTVAFVDYGLILALFVVGLYAARSRLSDPSLRFILMTAGLYAATLVVFFVHERYRMPLLILMVPFAAHALAVGWSRLGSSALFAGTATVAAGYVASLLLTLLIPAQFGWSLEPAAARRKESERLDREQVSYNLKQTVVQAPTTDALMRLSKDLYLHRLHADAVLIAERALIGGESAAYWNVFNLIARQRDVERMRALDRRIAAVVPATDRERRALHELRAEIERRLQMN